MPITAPKKPSTLVEDERFQLGFDKLEIVFAREYGMVTIFLVSPGGAEGRGVHIYSGDPEPDAHLAVADAIYETPG